MELKGSVDPIAIGLPNVKESRKMREAKLNSSATAGHQNKKLPMMTASISVYSR